MRVGHLSVDAPRRSFAHASRHIAEDQSAENADLRVREKYSVPKPRSIEDRRCISECSNRFELEETAVAVTPEFERRTQSKRIEISDIQATKSDAKPTIADRSDNRGEERRNESPFGIPEIASGDSCCRLGGPFL